MAIMRLLGPGAYVTGGRIRIADRDIYRMGREELRQFRWTHVSMVFQSAMNVLNPVRTIGEQMVDTFRAHDPRMSKREAMERSAELLRIVRIDPARLGSFPHELSGGMRQRVVIAIAIAFKPKLVIMDEPTTALDVVVQRSILEQVMELQEQFGFSILFISHDITLVNRISNRVGVMYAGRLVEMSDSQLATEEPPLYHPYAMGLHRAIPTLDAGDDEISGIPGSPPVPLSMPPGCAFHPRCPYVRDACASIKPDLTRHGDYQIACHLTTDELRSFAHAD